MSTASAVNGQVIGMAHYATRALAERLLPPGTTFFHALALNAVEAAGGTVARRALIERLTGAVKLGVPAAEATVAELTSAALLEERPGGLLALTPAGDALIQSYKAGVAGIAAGLYGDLPAEDLAAAGRVLTEVTARADAMLAAG
ncbi:hypothetical protein [Streptomyces sp. CB02460]|uniref:hypothetical protein n=1 Tax=Streptomyces sp. CB02460 TaxID=1703941 RepID=UPI00093C15F6|nr:hypothetical protein [Streptomyces sp. CB02460]OKJ73186.1 hypothetical protein AMK30_19835 [Streptomyces sp. CB02460]